ncbi:MAG: translation initiation factor [Phormidesmis sp. RL_2_1]|nr:translation initiation factor [Phormidesmis sp. RL_2_1]
MVKQNRGNPKNQPSNPAATDRVVYQEFGPEFSTSAATERAVPDLPPDQQDLLVQISRKGRKGKSVTIISGFAHGGIAGRKTLEALAKQLKAQCGSGGTVKDNTIELQGEHVIKAVSWLVKKGYKAKASGG